MIGAVTAGARRRQSDLCCPRARTGARRRDMRDTSDRGRRTVPTAQAVIEGRDQIEQKEGDRVDAVTDDRAGLSRPRGQGYQQGATSECQDRADQVTDAVEAFGG